MRIRSRFESLYGLLFLISLLIVSPESSSISTAICASPRPLGRSPAAVRTCDRLFEELGPRLKFKLAGASAARQLKAPRSLRIGHYNVSNYRSVPTAGRRNSYLKSPVLIERIVETIKRESPDVLFLSEIENRASLDDLSRRLDHEYHPTLIEGNDLWPFDVAVMIRKNLPFEVTIQSHRALTHRYLGQTVPVFSRDLLLVELRMPGESRPTLSLAASHLKSMSPPSNKDKNQDKNQDKSQDRDKNSVGKRTMQIGESLRIISENQSENAPKGFVFIADFNADVRTGVEFEKLRHAGFRDAFEVLHIPLNKRSTHSSFKNSNEPEYLQLDGMFVSPQILNREALLSAYVVPDRDHRGRILAKPNDYTERDRRPSDHNMVIMEVDLTKLR